MTTTEIERDNVGTNKRYYVVYRHKTYDDGEVVLQSCILLPAGHALFGVPASAKGLRSSFPLPLITVGHGTFLGNKQPGSWWLVFEDKARTHQGIERLPLADIKQLAIPQIVATLEESEADPGRFSRRRRSRDVEA
jgi:hypothetical protein